MLYLCVRERLCVFVHQMHAHGQKRVSDPWKLVLQEVVSHHSDTGN